MQYVMLISQSDLWCRSYATNGTLSLSLSLSLPLTLHLLLLPLTLQLPLLPLTLHLLPLLFTLNPTFLNPKLRSLSFTEKADLPPTGLFRLWRTKPFSLATATFPACNAYLTNATLLALAAPTLTTYTHSSPNTHAHTHNSNPQTFSFLLVSTTAIRIPLRQAFPLLRNSFLKPTLSFPTHAFTSPLSIFLPISLPPKETTWKHWTPLLLLFLTVTWFLHWTHIFFPLALIISTGLPTQLLTFEPHWLLHLNY